MWSWLKKLVFGNLEEIKMRKLAQTEAIRKAVAAHTKVHGLPKRTPKRVGGSPSLNYHRDQDYFRRNAEQHEAPREDDSTTPLIVLGAITLNNDVTPQNETEQPKSETGGGGSFSGGGSTDSWDKPEPDTPAETGGNACEFHPGFGPKNTLPAALKRGPRLTL